MQFFITDPLFLEHQTGHGHPEQPARLISIERTLTSTGFKTDKNCLKARAATKEEILLCHTQEYFELVQREIARLPSHRLAFLSTGDVVISSKSMEAALTAAGAVITAVDQVMTQPGSTVFCAVRPPGHHACSDRGMGFCLFNNVAIGARYALKNYPIQRVLIVDWDLHHGNGTQEIFYRDGRVYYFSTHEKGIYPQTGFSEEKGEGAGAGCICNIPILPTAQARLEIIQAFESKLQTAMQNFRPELVMISAGFDAHHDDPLGHLNLTDEDFAHLTRIVKKISLDYADGRVVSVLEGGYHLAALASATLAHVKELR